MRKIRNGWNGGLNMALDILSYLMGQKTGGSVKLITREQWNAMSASEKQSYGLVGVTDSTSGYLRGSLYYGADYDLKAVAESTTYCRLSTTVGDGASFNDRWFYRTSDEPILLCGFTNGNYNSYAVITKSSVAPAQTYSSYGDLGPAGTIVVDDTTLYVYVMSGMWRDSLTTIIYTYEDSTLNFTTDAYLYSSSGKITVLGTATSDMMELLSMYAAL